MDRIELPSHIIPIHYEIHINPDINRMRFSGFLQIKVEIRKPTSTIVLNSVDLYFQRATLLQKRTETKRVHFDRSASTATLEFSGVIEPGQYDLQIAYEGKIYESAQGLFITKYNTDGGQKHMLVTQFEAVAARRFMPCWDEPARKATFSLSVTCPQNELAISNMPVESVVGLEDGLQRVRFQTTPRMSCYLLFLGIGDLERKEGQSGTTKVAVVARKGSAEKGEFALGVALKILSYYNSYFDIPYPLPKLDLMAVPGAGGFSAMENWGAILYFESSLLLDRQISTEADRQRVFIVVAHEMAHQWFGNLVTMDWWDDLWLNEGFASWMENKAADHFFPQWNKWLQSESDRQRAMRQDSNRTTHPVVQPVISADQADEAFDDITYRKGQAVIRMLEAYIGEQAFRDGVRNYMKRYAYQNTVTDDFWMELERVSRPLKVIADEFTLQPGVPLISVETETLDGGKTKLAVVQQRFAMDDSAQDVRVWHTPVSAASVDAQSSAQTLLIAGPQPGAISVDGKPPVKVNIGQTGYFRSRYDDTTFAALVVRINSFSASDQLGLLNDAWALGEAGITGVAGYLDLTKRMSADADSVVWRRVIEISEYVEILYAGLAGRDAFCTYGRGLLDPIFMRIGWTKLPGEADNVAVLRESLLLALTRLGDSAVLNEARRRFTLFLANPDDPQGLPAAIRRPVLRAVALSADAPTYDSLYGLAKKETDFTVKDQLFVALASARDIVLANRSLDIALSDEPAKTTGPSMISRVSLDNPDRAWDFARGHLDAVTSRLDALQRNSFMPSLAARSTNPDRLPELRRFIDEHVPSESRRQAEKYVADLEFLVKVKAQRIPEIDKWIAGS
jgi:aminopeptidase N